MDPAISATSNDKIRRFQKTWRNPTPVGMLDLFCTNQGYTPPQLSVGCLPSMSPFAAAMSDNIFAKISRVFFYRQIFSPTKTVF